MQNVEACIQHVLLKRIGDEFTVCNECIVSMTKGLNDDVIRVSNAVNVYDTHN